MNYNEIRRKTKEIKVGGLIIGGNAPVSVQSMTNTSSTDYDALYRQIKSLEAAGCDLVRVAIPDMEAVRVLSKIKESDIKIPISADIHFDYKLAIAAAEAGADKIRVNPGNIGEKDRIKAVADKCRLLGIPIRVGVNGGSLDKKVLAKYEEPSGRALAESALENVRILESFDFDDIVVAVKSSNVARMTEANEIIAASCHYPIHLGVTEAGSSFAGTVKNSIGIGSLLLKGIGDTLRVSLTADPVLEIKSGRQILASLGMDNKRNIEIVSCPTCGRTKIDLIGLVNEFEARLSEITTEKKLKVAIMGCVVNGPGEASDADIGVAGGEKEAMLFRKGKTVRKIPEDRIIDTLIEEINQL